MRKGFKNHELLLVSLLLLSMFLLIEYGFFQYTGYVINNRTTENIPLQLTIENTPPVIDPIPDHYYNATDFVNITATASDINNDPLTFTYSPPLDNNGDWQTTANDWGIYNITVNVSDGQGGNDSTNFTLVIHGFPVTITYADDGNISLQWSSIPGATSYQIYYSNDWNDWATPQVTGLQQTSWKDTTANQVQQRFYRVGAVINGYVLKSIVIGKFSLNLGQGWNLVSFPLNLTSYELGEEAVVGNPVPIAPKNVLKRIYRYNNATDAFEMTQHYDDYGWIPATGSESFTALQPGRGYWFETNASGVVTFLGFLPQKNLTILLDKDYNVVGWWSLTAKRLGQESIYGNPLDVNPANSVLIIHRYRNEYDNFEGVRHFAGWGWWPFTRSESFTHMEPGRGYYFLNTEASTWSFSP